MLRKLVLLLLVACITLALAPQGRAQVLDPTTLHYVCTGTTTCAAGATTLVTGSTLPTFNITIQPGNSGLPASGLGAATLYVIALVPSTAPALSFSINGLASSAASGTFGPGEHLWSNGVTGFFAASHYSTANADFNAYASASGQSGTTPTGFNVYVVVFDVTVAGNASGPNWNAAGGTLLSVGSGGITGLPSTGFPVGTVLFAAMTSGQGGTLATLNSTSTLMVNSTPLSESLTIVPEPGTLSLFGSGLLGVAALVRRRLRGA